MIRGIAAAFVVGAGIAAVVLPDAKGGGGRGGPRPSALRVGLVLSVGGLGDRSFNDLANEGVLRAERELGVRGFRGEPGDHAEDEDYLEFYASEGCDLVVATGYLMETSVARVAARHPATRFALIDASVDAPNVASLLFREQEGAFLVGALAGLRSRGGTVGVVGGMDIPLIHRFVAGFEAGARAVRPGARVLSDYAGTFADPVKGKEMALSMIGRGADVLFQAAGHTGNGVIEAARERGALAIGVDANQNWVAPGTMLTSMLKRVDVAVFETVRALAEGRFRAGPRVFGLREDGVGWALDAHNRALVSPEDEARLGDLRRRIVEGTLVVPVVPEGRR